MNLKKIAIWLFLLYLAPGFVFAEFSPETANKWINFTDFKNVVCIAVDKNAPLAYCGSQGGLFVVDLSSGNVRKKYTNLDGLMSNNITAVYVDTLDRLWIGATDGSISILDYAAGTFRYIYDIKNSNESNKSINDFVQFGQYIFAATGYGIQKISVTTLNFVDAPYYQLGNYNSKTKVTSLAINGDKIFAGTVSGVAYARLYNTNLNNPSSWINYNVYPLMANVRCAESFDNKVFFGADSGFVYYDNVNWVNYPNPAVSNRTTKDIKKAGDNLYFISGNEVYYSNISNLSQINLYTSGSNFFSLGADNANSPLVGVYENGLLVNRNGIQTKVYPNCPYRNSFDNISIDANGNVWAAGGQTDAGFYKYDGNTWYSYTTATHPEIGNSNWFRRIVAGNGIVWALGYGGGPTRITGNTIKNFNSTNSILPGIIGNPDFIVPFGGAFDNLGNFWMSFYGTDNNTNLYLNTNDSVFTGYLNPSIVLQSNFEQVAIDNYNTKWIVSVGSSKGLYFFNENGTPSNPGDDIFGMYLTTEVSIENVTGVVVDRNNEVWFSSNNGVFIISNPLAAIQNPNNKPAPQKLGIISGNLKVPFTENCRCITVDILNQKWIGTENNGVFHLSSDGTTLMEQFNISNSPVLSNQINSIAVSNIDGRAYFGTLNGLSSVQTDAIAPLAEFEKIICSPNPFVVPANVLLKIDGLVENSSVKIFSLNGDVIAEFTSPGGKIASWDGRDKKGNYPPSGIYMVVGFTQDGSKVGKGKLAIIKK
jgi:ligand-binding sensor domain-containing protein